MTYFIKNDKENWPKISNEAREVFRKGAEKVINAPEEWFEQLDANMPSIKGRIGDPVHTARTRKHNRHNIYHWAVANISFPGDPVEPDLSPAMQEAVRDAVCNGTTELLLHTFRVAQNEAHSSWIRIVSDLTDNAEILTEVLSAYFRSSVYYVDSIVAVVSEIIEQEHTELLRGAHAKYRKIISLILNEATINQQFASQRLGYRLDQQHKAAIVWNDGPLSKAANIDDVVESILQVSSGRPLVVHTNAETRWLWFPDVDIDLELIRQKISNFFAVRVAFGSSGRNLQGFKQSHKEAIIAQRVLVRSKRTDCVIDFKDIHMISLLTRDEKQIEYFLRTTLGDLYDAEAIIRQSVAAFLEYGCSIVKASEQQGLHRNTVIRHLNIAEELLPNPIEEHVTQIGLALEIMRWLPATGNQHS